MEEKEDRVNASAVLNLAMEANQGVFEKVKGENLMFEELQKLMKPYTDKMVQEKTVTDIECMMTRFGIALEDACDAVGMTVEEFNRVKENRKKKEENAVKEAEGSES